MPEVIRILLKIRDKEIEPAIVVIVAKRYAHRGHRVALRGKRHPRDDSDLLERAVMLVMIEVGVQAVVGHEQIRPPVVVVVRRAHGEIFALRLVDLGSLRHIAEGPVSIIVIEDVRRALVHAGRTARSSSADVAVARAILERDVPSDVKIQRPSRS